MKEEYKVPADGTIPYLYFTIPTNLTEDKYDQAIEIQPGNRRRRSPRHRIGTACGR